jgi:Flp pilus assembly protein TadG
MSSTTRFRSMRQQLRRFRAASGGNIAIFFALAMLPVFAFIGASVDYSRFNSARTSMQSALDSTALMLSRDLSQGTITTAQISATAQSYFAALYTSTEAQSVSVTASYTSPTSNSSATVVVNASGSIPTDFMKLAGLPNMNFNASSTASWGANLLRVALVLDNTGSMANSGKIGALKTAAKDLVTKLSALARNTGDVMISVVPFEIDVNVGTSNVNASWLRWDRWDPSLHNCNGTISNDYYMSWSTCLDHGYSWNHTVGTPSHSLWNGCVTDRNQSYDVDATVPSSTNTDFIADQDVFCPAAAVLPLTYNWTDVNNTIDAMSPNGATNQTIGLQWGWLSLMQQDPLNAPAESSTSIYQHIIILFTDGLNTGDRWYGDLSNTSSQVDTRMRLLCDKIKTVKESFDPTKLKYTIYTVQIDTDGAGQSAVLPYCASDGQKSFMLSQSNQIATAFSQIATQISQLRVAK